MSDAGSSGSPDWGQAAGGTIGAIGDIWGGLSKAAGFEEEAKYYKTAAKWEKYSSGLKEMATTRAVQQKLGQGRADVGASGLRMSGTASDVMRASAAEGNIARNVVGIQGKMDVDALLEQARQASAEASSAEIGGYFAAFGDLTKAASAAAGG